MLEFNYRSVLNRTNYLGSEILRHHFGEYVLGIQFCPVVLNKKQVISKWTELCREHPIIFQDGCLQAISGNAIQCLIDMNDDFDIIEWFIVSGNMAYGADDRRVSHGSPP
jgi:hypothetical protein